MIDYYQNLMSYKIVHFHSINALNYEFIYFLYQSPFSFIPKLAKHKIIGKMRYNKKFFILEENIVS